MNTSRCRSCGAPIRFVKTMSGKNHPLNAEPDPDGEWVITPRLGGNDYMMVKAGPLHLPEQPRYSSHFGTCPQSQNWSRK